MRSRAGPAETKGFAAYTVRTRRFYFLTHTNKDHPWLPGRRLDMLSAVPAKAAEARPASRMDQSY
jgi:hypothetical protein